MQMRTPPFSADQPSGTWPERLQMLAGEWSHPQSPEHREQIRSEIWVLLIGALDLKLRRRLGPRAHLDPDLAYDLAVTRALDLAQRFAREEWSPESSTPAQLQNYFALIAKNAIIDYDRSRSGKARKLEFVTEEVPEGHDEMLPHGSGVDRVELAEAVVECASTLTPRARVIWFLRTFHELSSRSIGDHPEVGMKSTAVDMALHRCRAKLRECLEKRGFDRMDFGHGVFLACWQAFRSCENPEVGERFQELKALEEGKGAS